MYKLLVITLAVAGLCSAGLLESVVDRVHTGRVRLEEKLGLRGPKPQEPQKPVFIPPTSPVFSNQPSFLVPAATTRRPSHRPDLAAVVQTEETDYKVTTTKRPLNPDLQANIKTDGKVTTKRPEPTRSDLAADVQTDEDDFDDNKPLDIIGPTPPSLSKTAHDPNNRHQIDGSRRCDPGLVWADGDCRTVD